MCGKDKLKFWCGAVVALLLVGGIGRFVYSKWELSNEKTDELKRKYAELKILEHKNETVSGASVTTESKESNGKAVDTLKISFRAVGLNRVSPGADQEIAYNVLNEIKSSPFFDASKTMASDITSEVPLSEPPAKAGSAEPLGTFSFKIVAKLKRPLTL